MTTGMKVFVGVVVAVVLFVGLWLLLVGPANSDSPSLRDQTRVDHIVYSGN